MPRAALIYNPTAGRSRRASLVDDIVEILRHGGLEVETRPTESAAEGTELARDAARRGTVDRILTLGGDGSLRAAAQGLLGGNVALGPIPLGTTNVVARALGIPLDPRSAARLLARAEARSSDVGLCTDGAGVDHVFLMQASAGLDAAVMAAVPPHTKRRAGRAAVAVYTLARWWSYAYPAVAFRLDGGPVETASHVVVANIDQYAGPFRIAPGAGFATRRLDLVTFAGGGRLSSLAYAAALLAGRHLHMRRVRSRPAATVVLESPLHAPIQLDGDAVDLPSPLTHRLADQRVDLLFAPATA